MRISTLIIAVALTLSSCVDTASRVAAIDSAAVASTCDLLPAITYDGKLDTQPTKDQIRQYNAKRNSYCSAQGDTK